MTDDGVGYGRPPKNTRFKAGVSGNPKGRLKRAPIDLADVVGQVLSAPMEYRDKGKVKTAPRYELSLKLLVDRAIKGNLDAADLILRVRAHALRHGGAGVESLQIADWLPDYPGQTADQKTREFAASGDAKPVEWWRPDE
jgi:hypothetical protein